MFVELCRCHWREKFSLPHPSSRSNFSPTPVEVSDERKVPQMTSLNTKSDSVSWTAKIKNVFTYSVRKIANFQLLQSTQLEVISPGNPITKLFALEETTRNNRSTLFRRKTIFRRWISIPQNSSEITKFMTMCLIVLRSSNERRKITEKPKILFVSVA
jgi:hypothetical protein